MTPPWGKASPLFVFVRALGENVFREVFFLLKSFSAERTKKMHTKKQADTHASQQSSGSRISFTGFIPGVCTAKPSGSSYETQAYTGRPIRRITSNRGGRGAERHASVRTERDTSASLSLSKQVRVDAGLCEDVSTCRAITCPAYPRLRAHACSKSGWIFLFRRSADTKETSSCNARYPHRTPSHRVVIYRPTGICTHT